MTPTGSTTAQKFSKCDLRIELLETHPQARRRRFEKAERCVLLSLLILRRQSGPERPQREYEEGGSGAG